MVFSSSLPGKLRKFKGLSPHERRLFYQAALLLPLVHLALPVWGYSRLRAVMARLFPLQGGESHASDTEILERARRLARVVAIAAQHGPYKASCLRRSLLVWGLLRREGVEGKICFGVRLSEGELQAHAWVEYKGMVLNDSQQVHARYTALREAFPPTHAGL